MSGSQTQTIRTFLVRLGFQTNTQQQQQFTSAMRNATAQGVLLADTLEAAARKVIDFARSIAEGMENMYFASQRTGVTVANLKALDFAFSNIGLGSQQATQSIEALAASFNKTPGMETFVNQLVGAGHESETLEEKLIRLGKRWQSMWGDRATRAQAIAEGLTIPGFDQKTITQLATNVDELEKQRQKSLEVTHRLWSNQEEAAKKSHEFMSNIRETSMVIEQVTIKVGELLMQRLNPAMKSFNEYLLSHTGDIADGIIKVFTALDKVGQIILKVVDALGGWENATYAILALWTLEKFSGIIGILIRISALLLSMHPALLAFIAAAAVAGYAYANVSAAREFNDRAAKEGWKPIEFDENSEPYKWSGPGGEVLTTDALRARFADADRKAGKTPAPNSVGDVLKNLPGYLLPGGGGSPPAGGGGGGGADAGGGGPGAAPTRENIASHQDFIEKMMPFALRESQRTGVDPRIILAQAALESNWGRSAPNNNYFGIKGQGGVFMTDEVINGQRVRVPQSFAGYQSMDESARGYGDFLLNNPRYGALRGAQGLEAQLEQLGRSGYATDPDYAFKVGGIARQLNVGAPRTAGAGGAQVSMSQTTTINVHGAGDAQGTARAVAGKQEGVNQNLVRNTRGALA